MKTPALLLAVLLMGCAKEEQECPSDSVPSFDQYGYLSGEGPSIWSVTACGSVVIIKGSRAKCGDTLRLLRQPTNVTNATVAARLVYDTPPDPCSNEPFTMSVDVSGWKGFGDPLTVNVGDRPGVLVRF